MVLGVARKTKKDWLATAVTSFAQKGPTGLTIDSLTKQLGVTKGSFYHHFANHDVFKQAFLQSSEESGTLSIIEALEPYDSALEKLHKLLALIVTFSTETAVNPENMLRAWAMHDETVRTVQIRIDQQRVAYVDTLMQELLPEAKTATVAAKILYAILVGAEQIHPPVTGTDLLAQFNELLKLYNIEQVNL